MIKKNSFLILFMIVISTNMAFVRAITIASHPQKHICKKLSCYNGDTLQYLKDNFVLHQPFKGFKLNFLQKKLELPIAFYFANAFQKHDGGSLTCSGLTLGFNSHTKALIGRKRKNQKKLLLLFVFFKNTFPYEQTVPNIRRYGDQYVREAKAFYDKQIIDSVTIVH